MSYWVSMDDAFPMASLPSPTIHQLPPPPPPPIEFAEPKSAAVKLAGGGLVRMEEGKGGTRRRQLAKYIIGLGPHILVPEFRLPETPSLPAPATEHSLAYVSWASSRLGWKDRACCPFRFFFLGKGVRPGPAWTGPH